MEVEVTGESSAPDMADMSEELSTEPISSAPGVVLGSKRPAPSDRDEDRKRICGPPPDISEKLEEEMASLGDDHRINIVEALRNLSKTLIESLKDQEGIILQVFARCIKFKPEKLTIYSTLAGLVNAQDSDFGVALLGRATNELEFSLQKGEFNIALRITTFIADLANTRVVSVPSIFQFLNRFVNFVNNENLQTDYFVFMILHTLPWVGLLLHNEDRSSLAELLTRLNTYISQRKKLHLKALQVWNGKLEQEQEDYIDSLWAQIHDLNARAWNEQHILRVDMAFGSELSASTRHEIPEFNIPEYSEEVSYPLPFIVFRLFKPSDVTGSDVSLPEPNSIERFLVEEDLNWIISNNYLNWKVCARELLSYFRADSIPLSYCIVEVVFSQMFRLPEAPYMQLFYGALLIELCRKNPEEVPQVLAYAIQTIYERIPHMQLICVERFINWFSYHLSNFQFRWSWDDWADAVSDSEFSMKQIFVREVIEKCMRFSYHKRMVEILPPSFDDLIPEEPVFKFVVDNPEHPAHEDSIHFSNKIRNKVTNEDIILSVKRPENEVQEGECIYDPDLVAIFTGTLLKLGSHTFSHTFAALQRYRDALAEFVKYADIMQPVLLRTIHECWGQHRQFVVLIIDKLLKLQILDPPIIVAWVFSGDLKDEIHRSWVWEIFNIAITRASKQYYVNKTNKENFEVLYTKKKTRLEQSKAARGDAQEDDIFPRGDDIEVDEEDMAEDSNDVTAQAKLASLSEQLNKAILAFEKSSDDLKYLVLDFCHKFIVSITEHLVECEKEQTPFDTPVYRYMIGRFRETLILNWKEIFLFWNDVKAELLDSAAVDDKIQEIFVQFRALKF